LQNGCLQTTGTKAVNLVTKVVNLAIKVQRKMQNVLQVNVLGKAQKKK